MGCVFRHSGDATHASAGGGRACGKSSPIGGFCNSTTLNPLVCSDPRDLTCFHSRIRLEVVTKKNKRPCGAAAAIAEQTARAEGKGADHRPSARWWPDYICRGTGGASNCTNGPNYGPGTAKWSQMDLARGFARGLTDEYHRSLKNKRPGLSGRPPCRRPRQRPRFFKCGVMHPNGRPPGVCERGKEVLVCGRVKEGLGVGDAPEGRSATRAYLGLTGEMARASARASLIALMPPTGMRALSHPPKPTQRRDVALVPQRAVALGAHGQRAMSAARARQ